MVSLNPAQVIGVRVGPIVHLGIVSDRFANGEPMVISNSLRAGGVAEEPLSVFQGRYLLVPVSLPRVLPAGHILSLARQKLGSRWNLLSWNCEHFVHWAYGLGLKSPQLDRASVLVGLTVFLISIGKA